MLLNWWKNGLRLKLDMRIYPDGLFVASLYGLVFWAARSVSVDQFNLGAGVRVAALLLFPPRLWPYLLIGEYAYFAHVRYPMIATHGAAWTILGTVLLMPAVMLVVKFHRQLMERKTDVWTLTVAMCSAIVVTLLNVGLSEFLWPTPPSVPATSRLVRYALGDFIGILTVAPLALLWKGRSSEKNRVHKPSVPVIACLVVMLVLGLCSAQVSPESQATRTTLQLLAALPAVALTCILGWQGAALSIPALNLIVGLTVPSSHLQWSFDSQTFTIQQILAIASVALLSLGSTISAYYHRSIANTFNRRQSARLARTAHYAGELDLRSRALEINRIGDSIDRYLSETASWLNDNGHERIAGNLIRTSSLYSRKFREQASMVYPTALEHVGLYLTLQAGGISEAWSSTGGVVQPRLVGDPCMLTVPLQLATYRAVTDAVSILLENECGHVRIHARCGRTREREGILVIVGMLDPLHCVSESTKALALERLSGRAHAYGGSVTCRGNRIRMLFLDPPRS